MALMALMNRIIPFLERDEYILVIYLDFSEAFNNVDHVTLLKNLAHTLSKALLWNALRVTIAIGNSIWRRIEYIRQSNG